MMQVRVKRSEKHPEEVKKKKTKRKNNWYKNESSTGLRPQELPIRTETKLPLCTVTEIRCFKMKIRKKILGGKKWQRFRKKERASCKHEH